MNTLVSIIVVTYNSSKFVAETLDSISGQTWNEIELIITDDCSEDNTEDICREWCAKNGRRFISTQIITVPKNTGTAANLNRGVNAARGEWVKFCAGDDALMPNCIEENIKYVSENSEIKVLFSYCRMYLDKLTEDCFLNLNPVMYPSHIITDEITSEEQYKLLLVSNRIPFAPSCFNHLSTLTNFGGIDENYPFSEDYQMWLSLTKNGIKLFFMEKETMKYRMHDASLSKQGKDFIVNPIYYKTEVNDKKLSYPFIPWDIRLSRIHSWYINQIFRIDFFNRKNRFNSGLYYGLNKLLNPFHYIVYIKSHYCKKHENDPFYK